MGEKREEERGKKIGNMGWVNLAKRL